MKKNLSNKNLKLRLNRETLTNLDQVNGGASIANCTVRTADFTNCPLCGNTNYITCLTCAGTSCC